MRLIIRCYCLGRHLRTLRFIVNSVTFNVLTYRNLPEKPSVKEYFTLLQSSSRIYYYRGINWEVNYWNLLQRLPNVMRIVETCFYNNLNYRNERSTRKNIFKKSLKQE